MRNEPKTVPKGIRPEEFKALIKVMPKKDIITKIAFLLAYGSGLRISEVLRLKPTDVHSNIFIEASKYGVERVVPLPKGWKLGFINFLPIGDHTTARTLQRKLRGYAKKAKINPIYTFHSLRHGFATRCLESGIPLNQIQVLLGHSNISTTNVYTRANPKDALKNYEDLF